MKKFTLLVCALFFIGAHTESIDIEIPPSDDIEGEWALVPGENGRVYKVHVDTVMNEPMQSFDANNDVLFELFTPENPEQPQFIIPQNVTSLKTSNFSSERPTRIIIHGWNSQGYLTPLFADAYFKKGNFDLNYIAVNWRAGADVYNYITARRRVEPVGAYVAKFIDFLVREGELDLRDLKVIGHSLGAHISGIAGKYLETGKIKQIIGLDPALPLFSKSNTSERLHTTDAEHIEIIHTNAGYLGFSKPIGHASFYPNGGTSQVGCGWDLANYCAHSRSYLYYIESIHSDVEYYALKCESFEQMKEGKCHIISGIIRMGGEPGNQGVSNGIYYLKTNKEPIFAQGMPIPNGKFNKSFVV